MRQLTKDQSSVPAAVFGLDLRAELEIIASECDHSQGPYAYVGSMGPVVADNIMWAITPRSLARFPGQSQLGEHDAVMAAVCRVSGSCGESIPGAV